MNSNSDRVQRDPGYSRTRNVLSDVATAIFGRIGIIYVHSWADRQIIMTALNRSQKLQLQRSPLRL